VVEFRSVPGVADSVQIAADDGQAGSVCDRRPERRPGRVSFVPPGLIGTVTASGGCLMKLAIASSRGPK
jgi:hypothetical protein